MTKAEFVKRAMQMRPSAKYWREMVMRAIDYNGMVDYKNAENSFRDVHPLVGAICERLARYHIEGSSYAHIRRRSRKLANKYHCVI
ncbi:MAG: hypothetical protein II649_06940 [Kiritimatiellae bacterium]|nr:hypothetical protein [Kiritimatiellia bacterium]